MDFLAEDPNSADSIGPFRPNLSNSINSSRKPSHSFLQKLFSRQPSMQKHVPEGLEYQAIPLQFDNADDSSHVGREVIPCPYIHPLGNRLEPRIESAPLAPRRAAEYPGNPMSRKKGEATYAARSCLSLDKAYEEPHSNISTSDGMSMRSSMLRESIAAAAAADASYLKEWDYYIKCYSEGRYSLTVPPGPPPRNSNFTYLPSTYPPNEIERLSTFQSSHIWFGSDIVWSSLEVERARSLIMAATTKFATPWAAISFFDHDNEIVQAERGYSRHLIPRHESIASHVLLTDEVMTVLDTKQDWRFLGNPLVIGSPKIRFFAGAPLLSANSQVIGVFSIFSPEPRASFTAVQRRDLLGLSAIATRQLTTQRDLHSSVGLQGSPLLEPGSSCSGTMDLNKPTSSLQPSLPMDTRKDSSITLRYHKASQNGMPRSRLFIDSEGRDALVHNGVHTPPSSDDSDAGHSPILVDPKGFGKNPKQLSLAAMPNQSPNDIRTPDSPTFDNLSLNLGPLEPEAFSLSDMDCSGPEPNPYNAGFFYKHDISESIARFRRQNLGFSSDDAKQLLIPHSNSPADHISDSCSSSIDSEGRETLLEEVLLLGENNDAPTADESEIVRASGSETGESSTGCVDHEATLNHNGLEIQGSVIPDSRPETAQKSVDVQAEARFAAEFWAKNLGFDAIYAVELLPKRNHMRRSKLTSPGNVETRILVAYGLPDPINFDILIHLDVLSGPGAITWENQNATPKEYCRGFMMPLFFKNRVLDYRSGGVVFGAFRRRPENLKSAEVERLQRAAGVLKEILSKSLSLRHPSLGRVDLHSPQPYPANEAIELSKISYAAGMATCARRKKPKNPVRWQLGGSDSFQE